MKSNRCLSASAVWLIAPFALAQTPVTMTQNITSTGGSVPQNIYAVDLNNDGVVNDRPLFEARNSVTGRGFSQVSAQLKRYFTIHERYQFAAYIGAENLFNTNNLNCSTTTGCTGAVINTANSSDLFREIAAGTSRNVQLGASFKF